ncbi:hypothetical protein Bbelb_242940 [Branchiostoma belcheri]|nr:hypothetical protein Bbelb_242940 [Branchiostoma belcheri]
MGEAIQGALRNYRTLSTRRSGQQQEPRCHRAPPAADKLPAVALPHLLADVLDATKHLSRLFQYRDITCSTLGTQVELRLVNNSFLSHCQRAGPDQVCNPWNQETQNTKLIMVKIQQPTTHQKATSNPQPVNQQPVTQQPVNPQQQPVIKQPVTQQPVNPQPTTRQPATHNQQPVNQQPVTQQPVNPQPTTRQPATHNPSTSNPSPSNPSTHNQQPVTQQPVNQQPVTQQPVNQQPTTSNPQPVNPQPTTRQPATNNPSTSNPQPATHNPPPSNPSLYDLHAVTNEVIDNLDLDTSDRLVVVVLEAPEGWHIAIKDKRRVWYYMQAGYSVAEVADPFTEEISSIRSIPSPDGN